MWNSPLFRGCSRDGDGSETAESYLIIQAN
jgi:hypothetical protein